MSVVDTARAEFEAAWIQGVGPGGTQNYRFILGRAMGLNAALRAENREIKQERKELRAAIRNLANDFNDLGERCGAAEAKLAKNERLKVCGNCAVWWDNVRGRTNGCMGRPAAQERCHFTPSRWTAD